MRDDRRPDGPPREDVLLPGMSGRSRLQWGILCLSVVLVVVDGIFWHGLLFGSRLWHAFLWVLVSCGLAIGGFAYWRRDR